MNKCETRKGEYLCVLSYCLSFLAKIIVAITFNVLGYAYMRSDRRLKTDRPSSLQFSVIRSFVSTQRGFVLFLGSSSIEAFSWGSNSRRIFKLRSNTSLAMEKPIYPWISHPHVDWNDQEVETGAHESVYFPKGHSAAKNIPRINKFV